MKCLRDGCENEFEFSLRGTTRKFCSDKCRRKHAKRARSNSGAATETRTCKREGCTNQFDVTDWARGWAKAYCCDECRTANHYATRDRKRVREYEADRRVRLKDNIVANRKRFYRKHKDQVLEETRTYRRTRRKFLDWAQLRKLTISEVSK